MFDLTRFLSILVPCVCGLIIYLWYDRPLGDPQGEVEEQHDTRRFEGFDPDRSGAYPVGSRSVFWRDQNGHLLELIQNDRLPDSRYR